MARWTKRRAVVRRRRAIKGDIWKSFSNGHESTTAWRCSVHCLRQTCPPNPVRASCVRLVGDNLQEGRSGFVSGKHYLRKKRDAKKENSPSTTKPCWPFMGGNTYVRFR